MQPSSVSSIRTAAFDPGEPLPADDPARQPLEPAHPATRSVRAAASEPATSRRGTVDTGVSAVRPLP